MVEADFQKLLPMYPQGATLNGTALVDSLGGTTASVLQGVQETLGERFEEGGVVDSLKVTLMFLKSGNPVPDEDMPVVFNGRNYRISPDSIEDKPGIWLITLEQDNA